MAKQLNEAAVLNELHGESAFFQASPTPSRASTPQPAGRKKQKKQALTRANQEAHRSPSEMDGNDASQPVDHTVDQQTSQPPARATERPSKRTTNASPGGAITQPRGKLTTTDFDMSVILPRPKAFYISEQQDEDLDVLVKKLADKVKGKVGQKIDRSVATRLIFEHVSLTHDETVAQLANLLIARLTSQLTSQPTG